MLGVSCLLVPVLAASCGAFLPATARGALRRELAACLRAVRTRHLRAFFGSPSGE
jgi:hypothetical protein